jgi:uncharacterized protein (DUF952 family)
MLIYKVFTERDFDLFFIKGETQGSVTDLQDGFIHFSTREQLCNTIRKHFYHYTQVVILAFKEIDLKSGLKWEASRDKELFPHYYDTLRYSQTLYKVLLKTEC